MITTELACGKYDAFKFGARPGPSGGNNHRDGAHHGNYCSLFGASRPEVLILVRLNLLCASVAKDPVAGSSESWLLYKSELLVNFDPAFD